MSTKISKALAMALCLTGSFSTFALTEISNEAELKAIASNPGEYYILTQDINLTDEWTPVGTDTNPFTGSFDGKGHTITGLKINHADNDYMGFFGFVKGATITDVAIIGADVKGHNKVGILAGRICDGTTVSYVATTGYVYGRDHVGGVVGDMGETGSGANTITDCMSTACVYTYQTQVGGICGWAKGTNNLKNNLFAGSTYCNGFGDNGGILGMAEDGKTTIVGNVSVPYRMVGSNSGYPLSYDGRYTHCIFGGRLNANSNVELTGNYRLRGTEIYDYVTGALKDQSNLDATYNGIAKDAADLQDADFYTIDLGWNESKWNIVAGWYPVLKSISLPFDGDYIYTADTPVEIHPDTKYTPRAYSVMGKEVTISLSDPTLATLESGVITFTNPGTLTVTLSTPADEVTNAVTKTLVFNITKLNTQIATAADIENIRNNPDADFVFIADIDMEGVNFTPIDNFKGSIDGQGHVIKNLRYENTGKNETAFIGNFSGSYIKDLGFVNAYFVGNANTAVVAGKLTSACTVSGIAVLDCYVQGRDHSASITGDVGSGATVKDCLSNSVIETREKQCGGIAGVISNGNVLNCIFSGTGKANAKTRVGGIVALLDDKNGRSSVKNCLAATVTAGPQADPFAANIIYKSGRALTLENNYTTDYTVRNGKPVETSTHDSENGAAVTIDQIRSLAWYTEVLGLDFENTWKFFPGAEGKMLPVLKWMNAPLPLSYFNMPDPAGVMLNYTAGNPGTYDCSAFMPSLCQTFAVAQTGGTEFATLNSADKTITAGDTEGKLTKAGVATFEVNIDETLAPLFTPTEDASFEVFVVNPAEVIKISTPEEFVKIGLNGDLDYQLEADIDLSEIAGFNGFFNDGGAFKGSLNGQGHMVKNFNLKFTGGENKGLFGKTDGATFENIAFAKYTIDGGLTGAKHVGLIGQGSATINNAAFIGEVTGNDHVGLVAGDADGIVITDSYATGKSTGNSQVGGFFGCTLQKGCTIHNCHSNVETSIKKRGWAGGFIGLIDKSNSTVTITNSVSTGDISSEGSGDVHVSAPFIGGNGSGTTANAKITFSDNLHNSEATIHPVYNETVNWPGKNTTADGGNVTESTGHLNEYLKTQAPYEGLGWNFSDTWTMLNGAVYKYPVLATVPVSDAILSGTTVGIESVRDERPTVEVRAAGGVLVISGTEAGAIVSVYDTRGVAVASATAAGTEVSLELPSAGFYIVSVVSDGNAFTAKVINR